MTGRFWSVLLLVPLTVFGQSDLFDFIPVDTSQTDTAEVIYLHGDIVNLHTEEIEVTVDRIDEDVPLGWSSAICVGDVCLAPFISSYTFSVAVGDTAHFTLDVYPFGVEGEGQWTVNVTESSTSEMEFLSFSAVYGTAEESPSFAFVPVDTNATADADVIYLHADIVSFEEAAIEVTLERLETDVPAEWSSAICVGDVCLAPFISSYTFSIEAGDTAHFTLDVYPYGVEGTGLWTVTVTEPAGSTVDSLHFSATLETVGIAGERLPVAYDLFSAYPNPTNATVAVELKMPHAGTQDLLLYDLTGRQVRRYRYAVQAGGNQLQVPVNGIDSGTYYLVTDIDGTIHSQAVSVIK